MGQYEPNAKSLQWLFTYDGIPSQSSMAARVNVIDLGSGLENLMLEEANEQSATDN